MLEIACVFNVESYFTAMHCVDNIIAQTMKDLVETDHEPSVKMTGKQGSFLISLPV